MPKAIGVKCTGAELKPFKNQPTCAKCLSTRTVKRYVGAYGDAKEHLAWICSTCGHDWDSECADAESEGEKDAQTRVGQAVCKWVDDYDCKPFGLKDWARRLRKGVRVDLDIAAILLEIIAEELDD